MNKKLISNKYIILIFTFKKHFFFFFFFVKLFWWISFYECFIFSNSNKYVICNYCNYFLLGDFFFLNLFSSKNSTRTNEGIYLNGGIVLGQGSSSKAPLSLQISPGWENTGKSNFVKRRTQNSVSELSLPKQQLLPAITQDLSNISVSGQFILG